MCHVSALRAFSVCSGAQSFASACCRGATDRDVVALTSVNDAPYFPGACKRRGSGLGREGKEKQRAAAERSERMGEGEQATFHLRAVQDLAATLNRNFGARYPRQKKNCRRRRMRR